MAGDGSHEWRWAVVSTDRKLEAIGQLLEAIAFVPIPSRRPAYSRADEVSGLTLLELALRLDHITRANENLRLLDRGHLRRSVSVDVDLRILTARQRAALTVRRPVRPESLLVRAAEQLGACGPAPGSVDPATGDDVEMLWIPLARQSRDNLAPVTITDSGGDIVPRLTSHTTAEVLVAGMARLLRIQVLSRRASRSDRNGADLLSVRARWLIERGMAHLIRHGYHANVEALATPPDPAPGGDADSRVAGQRGDGSTELSRIRREASTYLAQLPREHAEELNWLLDVAVREHLLIAMVPARAAHAHLTYEAPPIPVVPAVPPLGRTLRRLVSEGRLLPPLKPTLSAVREVLSSGRSLGQLLSAGQDLTVTYRTQVPRIVRSYHLSVEAAEEIRVRRFLLVTDADRKAVDNLINDLGTLAEHARRGEFRDVGGDVYRAELHDALARCAALARLRHADLVHYRQYLERAFRQFGDDLAELDGIRHTPAGLVEDLCRGDCSFWHLRSLSYHHERGDLGGLGNEAPGRLATALDALATYLSDAQMVFDLSLDNDPRENGSHTYWANVELPFGPRPTEPINARVHLDLADEPPALISSVAWMVAAILGVVLLLNVLLEREPGGQFGQADAAVAVLLLVPGIMLTRLDIPSTHSVLGLLRSYPRRIAHASVTVTTLLAVAVAADYGGAIWFARAAAVLLSLLLVACLAQIRARAIRRRALAPSSFAVPRWLAEAMTLDEDQGRDTPDLVFDAISVEAGGGDGVPTRPSIRAGHPIETVTAAARTAAERATGISFTVTHQFTRTPCHDDARPPFSSDSPCDAAHYRNAVGTFAFAVYGTTCEVTTSLDRDPRALESPGYLVRPLEFGGGPGFSFARGTTLVSSNYPGALVNVNEILLQLGTSPDLSLAQSLMMGRVLAELADRAVGLKAVPVSMQAPAAPPAVTTSDATELAGLSVGPYIRLGLSNSREHGDARIAFEVEVCRLAAELGLGVHLSEGRAGSSTRTWSRVASFDEIRYQQARALYAPLATTTPTEQIILTVVGPANARTTRSLRDVGRLLRDLGIGVHAASSWQVNQTNFLHLIMPRTATGAVSVGEVYRDPVGFLSNQCGTGVERDRTAGALTWPSAYTVVLADVVALPNRPNDGRWVVPFWVAWDLPAGLTGADRLTRYLMDAFAAMNDFADGGGHEWVTYLHARRTGRDRWRGRAKVSVDVPSRWIRDGDTHAMGTLAKRVQESVINSILDDFGVPVHTVSLHVAWGERWLGRPVEW
jgi:uncharacterized membrane protein